MIKTLVACLVVLAVATVAVAQPQAPTLPNTWSAYINYYSPKFTFAGAMYLDYTTQTQRTDVVSLLGVSEIQVQSFDSATGKFTGDQTALYSTPQTKNGQQCVKSPATGKVIDQSLAGASFVGTTEWFGTPAYLWSASDNGEAISIYSSISGDALLAIEAYNTTTNVVDAFVAFQGQTSTIPQGVFAIPSDISCTSTAGLAADAAAPSDSRSALDAFFARVSNVLA